MNRNIDMRLVSILVGSILLGSLNAISQTPIADAATLPNQSRDNERDFLRYIQPVVGTSGMGARLYFSSNCGSADDWAVPFPRFDLRTAGDRKRGLEAVQGILRNEKELLITGDKGIARIRMREVNDAILRTWISTVTFSKFAQYNPALAVGAVVHSKDVQKAMSRLGVSTPTLPVNMLIVEPSSGAPHIPAKMRNVTMDEALDKIAIAFRGVVFYGACKNSKVFQVSFDGGRDFRPNSDLP